MAAPSAVNQSRDADQQNHFENSADFANYFCSYEFLYHQKQMLEDTHRMQSYMNAIMKNKALFKDKIVLDVGAGSGILSIWSAQAGAKKVYGIEATKVSQHARRLVEANGLSNIVEIIQCTVEDINLPTKVDIIISEWMGYFLLRESMLDSVLVARDRWLKPGGALFPSHADLVVAPIYNDSALKAHSEYEEAMHDWTTFVRQLKGKFHVDMETLTTGYHQENWVFYMETSQWAKLSRKDLVGSACVIKTFDLNTLTVEDFKYLSMPFQCQIGLDTKISGFAGWFTTTFAGSEQLPCAQPHVVLDTSPNRSATHWGQQVFHVYPFVSAMAGDLLEGTLELSRKKENQRLLNVRITHTLRKPNESAPQRPPLVTNAQIQ